MHGEPKAAITLRGREGKEEKKGKKGGKGKTRGRGWPKLPEPRQLPLSTLSPSSSPTVRPPPPIPPTPINSGFSLSTLNHTSTMSFLFGGQPKMSSEMKIAQAEMEVDMISDMFTR